MKYISNYNQFGVNIENRFKSYGKDISVLSYTKNRESKEVSVDCVFTVGNNATQVTLPLDDKLVRNLQKLGYPATASMEQHLREYIDQQIDTLNCELLHSHLGWEVENGVLGFKGDISLGYAEKSRYSGNLNIKPKSSLKEFRKDFSRVIEGNTKIEYALVMGLSGCMVGYLNCVLSESIDTLIYDVYGGSTTGKTTIMHLAVSTCGNPANKVNEESLFATCSATKNALVAKLNENYGLFVGYDEVGRLGDKANSSDLIYQIADGTGKARCTKYGNVKDTSTWATACGFTGEMSIQELTDNKDGLLNRVFSFDNIAWTKDENQANEIDEFAFKHCALPVHLLAHHLLKCDKDNVISEYHDIVAELQDILPVQKQYRNRAAKKSAIILLTARHTAKALKVNLSEEGIKRFLVANAFSEFKLEHERAFSRFVTLFYTNISLFCNHAPSSTVTKNLDSRDDPYLPSKIGYYCFTEEERYSYADCQLEYCVISVDVFEEWMKKGGFSNTRGILRKWRELKILDCERDRLAEPRYLVSGGNKVPSYKIMINAPFEYEIAKPWTLSFTKDMQKYLDTSESEAEKNCGASLLSDFRAKSVPLNFIEYVEQQYLSGNPDYQEIVIKYFRYKVDKILSVNRKVTKTERITCLTQVDKNNKEIIDYCEKENYSVDWCYGAAFKGKYLSEESIDALDKLLREDE